MCSVCPHVQDIKWETMVERGAEGEGKKGEDGRDVESGDRVKAQRGCSFGRSIREFDLLDSSSAFFPLLCSALLSSALLSSALLCSVPP